MEYFKTIGCWIGPNILTFLNLIAFLFSVIILWRTMQAAERQAERASKPVIILMRKNFEQPKNEPLRPHRFAELFIPAGMRNVGNGTALDVRWQFKRNSGEVLISGMIASIQPSGIQKTGLTPNELGESCLFECDYLSVDNDKYQSIIKIENLKVTSIETKKLS